jgi:hypothetical protein
MKYHLKLHCQRDALYWSQGCPPPERDIYIVIGMPFTNYRDALIFRGMPYYSHRDALY